jgi:hypothetical protein
MDLIAELRREFGSHLNASENGWDFAAGYGEVMSAVHASAFLNSNRDPKKKPVVLPTPWSERAAEPVVSVEERVQLREQLKRRSAFAS